MEGIGIDMPLLLNTEFFRKWWYRKLPGIEMVDKNITLEFLKKLKDANVLIGIEGEQLTVKVGYSDIKLGSDAARQLAALLIKYAEIVENLYT